MALLENTPFLIRLFCQQNCGLQETEATKTGFGGKWQNCSSQETLLYFCDLFTKLCFPRVLWRHSDPPQTHNGQSQDKRRSGTRTHTATAMEGLFNKSRSYVLYMPFPVGPATGLSRAEHYCLQKMPTALTKPS